MINVIIDQLTNSIVNRISGDVFDTEVLAAMTKELAKINKSWYFDWNGQRQIGDIYKLVIKGNPQIIQGLICVKDNQDNIYIALIENAPFNLGSTKVYEGVAGNLFAFACKLSFDKGYEGYVSFHAKTELIQHYQQTLGAIRLGNSLLMYIDTQQATKLIDKYFKDL